MAILVYAESLSGRLKKNAFEAVTYGKKLAETTGDTCIALVLGEASNAAELGEYGADKVVQVNHNNLSSFDSQTYTDAIAQTAEKLQANILVLSHTSTGKSLAGRLSVRLKAGLISGANALPEDNNGFVVQKPVFSGKAIGHFRINTPVKIISLMGNALKPEKTGAVVSVESMDLEIKSPRVRIKEVKRAEGRVPLPEAEKVVSAGRGVKEPGNWGIIEDLAETLSATTACSRPVADAGWRPHHEHVGQTGIAIRPNLYIAIGISGAIQHLAGVNNSKVIVVINKDPEAPFFKAADYGVVGDLFEVVPKLTEAIKKFKAS
jgi:electron transfer flavoprotein alpha subunit